jgi:hypothetical protein
MRYGVIVYASGDRRNILLVQIVFHVCVCFTIFLKNSADIRVNFVDKTYVLMHTPWANPMITSYYVSVVEIYDATNSITRF